MLLYVFDRDNKCPIQNCIELSFNLRVGVVPKTSESLEIEGFFELFYPL